MDTRSLDTAPAERESPRRTYVPRPVGKPPASPTCIPAPRGAGLFSGWGVKL